MPIAEGPESLVSQLMSGSPIAVCIIVENLPVPLDRRVWQEARTLRAAGYRVSIICPKGKGFEKKYEEIEGIEIYRHRIWEAEGPLGYAFEYLWALILEFWLALKIYFRRRFKVMQACNPPDTIFLVGLFFKLFGVRFIFDHHDLNPELFEVKFGEDRKLLHRLVLLAERWTYKTARVSIATNESFREVALTRGGKRPEQVFVVRSCPTLDRIRRLDPAPELKQGKRFMVVYLGVMGPQEGLDLFLQAIAYLVKTKGRQDIQFVFIGGGTEQPSIEQQARQMGLDSCVTFTGWISVQEERAMRYLSTADVCVAPDPRNPINDRSTMNKILEYMACARPVVLFDLTEGRRSAGDAALYAKPNDPLDFAGQILTLLNSESLRERLGAAGRKRIEEQLNWENESKSLLAAYEKALS